MSVKSYHILTFPFAKLENERLKCLIYEANISKTDSVSFLNLTEQNLLQIIFSSSVCSKKI